MNAIKVNIYDVLFWSVFASFFGIAGYVFTAIANLASTVSAM